jgi:hypothetical protein
MTAKKVFISYSHDSPEHSERVLSLAWALRNNGIDVDLDQFHKEEIVDWPRWCNEQTSREHSDFVVCVCTPEYKRRLDGHVPPEKGKGVYWEGSLIDDDVYDEKGNIRLIPILFDDEAESSIPRFLRGWTHCRFRQFALNDAGYEHLIRILTGQASVEKNPLGTIPMLPTKRVTTETQSFSRAGFKADISRIIDYAPAELVGREDELKLLSDAWDKVVRGENPRAHILSFVALGGEGKTSVVAKWAAELAHRGWPGCDAAFAWSFYSQGTSEKTQASSDTFLAEALRFFGDEETAGSAKSGYEKGKRLAQLVAEKRGLLILDGVEPLQYAPGPPMDGKLKDDGVASLLKLVAGTNRGLCILTTRYSITDLRAFWQTTAPECELKSLSIEAGIHLLKTLRVTGPRKDFEALIGEVKGHALTLNLLGTYLRDAHGGDIRKRDRVKLEEANAEQQNGHAFHVMDVYVNSLKTAKGRPALALLRLLGLFDRPASADCLNALWQGKRIAKLTDQLAGLDEAQRNLALGGLERAKLLTMNRDAAALVSIDAHPLIRDYFAKELREHNPGPWRRAHRRLYEHLRDTTEEGDEPTLKDLEPLYQAITHGCKAGLHRKACDEVYYDRIVRGNENYSAFKLGAVGSDMAALSSFFEQPWSRLSKSFTKTDQAWLMNEAGFRLGLLGRLTEAQVPLQSAVKGAVRMKDWANAATYSFNLCDVALSLGAIDEAIGYARNAVMYADRSRYASKRYYQRGMLAVALNMAGKESEASSHFERAEKIRTATAPDKPELYPPNIYCDLLLSIFDRAVWQQLISPKPNIRMVKSQQRLHAISLRAETTLKISVSHNWLLRTALGHLTLGCAQFYMAILNCDRSMERSKRDKPRIRIRVSSDVRREFDLAVDWLRRASVQNQLPQGLLRRSLVRFCSADRIDSQVDLDEAWEIAEKGPMPLHMADIHLYRARLFHDVKPYPWNKFADGREGRGPKDDLKDARKLIEQCGYWRRKEELEDAEEAAKGWT